MDEGKEEKRACPKPDRLSTLPDSLLCEVLSNLKTKDVVRTSVLSPRWRNVWKYVPVLNLNNELFDEKLDTYVSFVDSFLGFESELHLQKLKFRHNFDKYNFNPNLDHATHIVRWIENVVKRNVQHIDVWDRGISCYGSVQIPKSMYTCGSLVSLTLCGVTVDTPEIVSLPCLKVISLDRVEFQGELGFDMLILGSPVLERLSICKRFVSDIGVMEVCSQSLKYFSLEVDPVDHWEDEDSVLTIDAPKLEYLELRDQVTANFVVENCASLVKVYVDVAFYLFPGDNCGYNLETDDLEKMTMIYNFLLGISSVKDMVISSCTLEIIYDYSELSRHGPVPLFQNLSSLRVHFTHSRWGMLPIFLESCPNLKSIVVGSRDYLKEGLYLVFSEPRCYLSSLEYVEIARIITMERMEMELVRYFLEFSPNLKTLTLWLDESERNKESVILQKILSIPRRSTSCAVVVNY